MSGSIEQGAAVSQFKFVIDRLNRNKNFEGFDDIRLFRLMSENVAMKAAQYIQHSVAQLRQDLLVAAGSSFKRNGYFVEIGATDGSYLSNTLLLETKLGWSGILAEPARGWHADLFATRKAAIDTRCVLSKTGKTIMFREVSSDQALSTIVDYAASDLHHTTREVGEDYVVETVSLNDLLYENGAPEYIDYLSIDTEGSELEILSAFDFDVYRFGIISCEHNYTENRDKILRLLKSNGYVRVMNHISLFDDWYIHSSKMSEIDAVFPGWKQASDQSESGTFQKKSQNDQIISVLQETVQNLIIERDAYKAVVDVQMPAEIAARDKQIDELLKLVSKLN